MKSMKTLLLGTAIAAVAGIASADNYKTQLDNLNTAWECQAHFERGTDIAGSIDEFEFCVWYLNNNREGFIRNDMFYDILPTGDVIAVKKNLLTTEAKAKKAIKTVIKTIIEEKIVVETETVIVEKIVESGVVINALRDDIQNLTDQLTAAATASEIDATEIARLGGLLKEQTETISGLEEAKAAIEAMLASVNDGITAADVESVRSELQAIIDAERLVAEMKAEELGTQIADLTTRLGAANAEIDILAGIRADLEEKNQDLQDRINTVVKDRDALTKELANVRAEAHTYSLTFNQEAIDTADKAGRAAVQALFDEAIEEKNSQIENLKTAVEELKTDVDEARKAGFAAGRQEGILVGINEVRTQWYDYTTIDGEWLWSGSEYEAAKTKAFNDGVASVDITSDNAEAFQNGVDSVDITSDNEGIRAEAFKAGRQEGLLAGIEEVRTQWYDYTNIDGEWLFSSSEVDARIVTERLEAFAEGVASVDTQSYFDDGAASVDFTHELNIKGRFGIMGVNIHDFGNTIISEDDWTSINVQPVVDAYINSLDLDVEAQTALDLISESAYTKKLASWTSVEADGQHQVLGGNDYVRVTLGTKDTSPDTWINITRLETYLANDNWDNVVNEITTAAKRAYEEGYNDGYEDGYKDGYKDGFKDGVNSLKS